MSHGGDTRSFYASALAEAERPALAEAAAVEGLADEVALLRMRLRDAIERHPDDIKLVESGVRMLIQSLLAHHRLSPKQADNLGDAVTNVLEEFGQVLRTATDE